MNKLCACCKTEKQMIEFPKDKQKSDGFSSYCKDCARQKNSARYFRTSNPTKRYTKRHAASEAEYAQIWRAENKDLVKSYRDKWSKQNTAKIREKNMRRYISQRQQTPTWLNAGHKAEMEGFYMFCQIFNGFQVDHIIPVRGKTVSGLHVPWNMQVLTCKQNRAKGNKLQPMEIT